MEATAQANGGGLEERVATKTPGREVYTYTVPASFGGDVREIGLIALTADEELLATKRARGDAVRLGFELAKQSVYSVNGRRVSLEEGTLDSVWNKMSPKVRACVLAAWTGLHNPPEEDVDSFLKSVRIRV